MGEIIKRDFRSKDWCVEERCPCLTCKLWLHHNPKCACKPCEQPGLMEPEKVLCYKTSNGKYGKFDVISWETGEIL